MSFEVNEATLNGSALSQADFEGRYTIKFELWNPGFGVVYSHASTQLTVSFDIKVNC